MTLRRDRPAARLSTVGARCLCLIVALSVLPACPRKPGEEPSATLDDSRPAPRPLTEAEKIEANGLLQRTALLRRNQGHPEWEHWTADDLSLHSRDVGTWYVYRPDMKIEALHISYVRREEKGRGRDLYFTVEADNEVIRQYNNLCVRAAAKQEERDQGPIAATLTFEQAAERARQYVGHMMGSVPADLVLDEVRYGRHTPFWYATFTRYEGWIPYLSQDLKLVFSERYGVAEYSNSYLDRWEGTIRISPEAAIEMALTQKERIDRKIQRAGMYLEAGRPSLVLRRPPRILSGHPYLMHVVRDNPRKVHAVWYVAFPFQWLSDDSPEASGKWDEIEVLVDAETGEVLPD